MQTLMRKAPWVVFLSLIVTVVAAVFATRLYRNLRTEFEELLPRQARSVRDLDRIRERMESSANLALLVFSEKPEASKRFVTELAETIERELGDDVVSRVEYRIDREIAFYKRRRPLMMELKDLEKVRRYVQERIRYEHEIRNPLNIFNGATIAPPVFDERSLTDKYSGKVSDYAKFKDGYYAMRGGRIRAVLVYVSGRALGVSEALRVKEGVDRVIARVRPKYGSAADFRVEFTGDVENLIEERDSLIADLEKSTVVVALLVMLALAVYYRNALATLALVASLFAGTIWTFGLAYFITGYLNANSAFLGSIVLGNGINFGIVLLARYLEERSRRPHPEAMSLAVRGSLPGTLTAALAAALSYGSLGLTTFRGFRQFGVIGLLGMVVCWVAAFTLLPALLTVLDRWRPLVSHRRTPLGVTGRPSFARVAARVVWRFPRAVLVAGLVATVALGAQAARHHGPVLETDTSRLRDRRSLEQGSGHYSKYLNEMFGRYLSPLVILPDSRSDAKEIARRLRALRDSQGKDSLIADVSLIDDFVPARQGRKIEVLKDIEALLPPRLRRRLSPRDRRLLREYITPESLRPFGVADLPPLIRARFRERDGSVGKLVLVSPVFDASVLYRFENQKRLIDEVRGVADAVEPGAPVVGQMPLTVDMIGSITTDGPRATLFALVSVLLLTVVLLRRVSTILEAQFALLLGVGWMACAALALGLKVNFLNFIALPITFGIGVDYGVNLLSRIRSEGVERTVEIVSTTGGAVSLASLTTIIGYSSLLIAGNQGFVSFGRLAVLGEITCLTAAIFMLPALMRWRALRRADEARAGEVLAQPLRFPERDRRHGEVGEDESRKRPRRVG